jgi:Legionella pneumophila major outer membrane protein precursor
MGYTQYAVMTALVMTGMVNVNSEQEMSNPLEKELLERNLISGKTEIAKNSEKDASPIECAFGHKCDWSPKRSSNLWISGDLLYWTVSEDGFDCNFGPTAIHTTTVNEIPTTAITEHNRDLDFDWEPGFRIGIGGDWPCSGWDTGAFWTWYHGRGHGHQDHNHAHWKMHFNVADAVFGRRFWVGKCVNLRPFGGFRYAQIEQTLRSNLQTKIIASTGSGIVRSTYHKKQKYWGFGPELGLEADFYIGKRWSVYGDLDGAVLYGHNGTSFHNKDASALANNICNSSGKSHSMKYVLDYGLGIRYELNHWTLQLGLEQHTYFGFNAMGCRGNLNLYGANLSAALHF